MEENQKTDLAVANQTLMDLVPNISALDRAEAPYSTPTVIKYLRGQGPDLDTAMELISFFRKKIEDRRRLLAGA
jgi:hypothetical protein